MNELQLYPAIAQFPVIVNWMQSQSTKNQQADRFFLEQLDHFLAYKLEGKTPDTINNTYLKAFAVPQIVLFDLLANGFPLVKAAQQLVETSFLHFIRDARHICLIDLGIGRGLQVMQWLKALQLNTAPISVTVVGIELTEPALAFTKSQFENIKNELSFSFDFHLLHMPMEDVTAGLLEKYIPSHSDSLFVNASLSMHHIQSVDQRTKLFEEIRNLSPGLFTLIEPHADTFTDMYENRLLNAVEHFSALFNYVNHLTLSDEEKRILKTFFSNDFFDPVALPDTHRFEKLLPAAEWNRLARVSGLNSVELISFVTEPEGFLCSAGANDITYSFQGINLLSVMGFKS